MGEKYSVVTITELIEMYFVFLCIFGWTLSSGRPKNIDMRRS